MLTDAEKALILTTKVRIKPEFNADFVKWQAALHGAIVAFPGFSSLEISLIGEAAGSTWVIVQRFQDSETLSAWQKSPERKKLFDEIKKYLFSTKPECLLDLEGDAGGLRNGITEVFVTQVSPDKEEAYRVWIGKIHQAEAEFQGFQGVYVQAPKKGQGRNWITFLQFDKQVNLDRWLESEERKKVLQEGQSLIDSLESHRVISPYAGWFAKVSTGTEPPSLLKQSMIVLLVLFPIVMLELKYLSPLTSSLNLSLATFISNAISVMLLSWPMVPLALRFLGWWLKPRQKNALFYTLLGTGILCALYLIEIAIFWA